MNDYSLGKDAGQVGGLSSGLYDDARGENKGEVINIVQDKDGKGGNGNNEGTIVKLQLRSLSLYNKHHNSIRGVTAITIYKALISMTFDQSEIFE